MDFYIVRLQVFQNIKAVWSAALYVNTFSCREIVIDDSGAEAGIDVLTPDGASSLYLLLVRSTTVGYYQSFSP